MLEIGMICAEVGEKKTPSGISHKKRSDPPISFHHNLTYPYRTC